LLRVGEFDVLFYQRSGQIEGLFEIDLCARQVEQEEGVENTSLDLMVDFIQLLGKHIFRVSSALYQLWQDLSHHD
jgi:hypothetical protein